LAYVLIKLNFNKKKKLNKGNIIWIRQQGNDTSKEKQERKLKISGQNLKTN
jgi:hypothetical protein